MGPVEGVNIAAASHGPIRIRFLTKDESKAMKLCCILGNETMEEVQKNISIKHYYSHCMSFSWRRVVDKTGQKFTHTEKKILHYVFCDILS